MITLSIIGVVAALTIPSLVVKNQEKELEVAFKKEYSQLTNALHQTQIESPQDWNTFWEIFQQKLNIVKNCTGCLKEYRGLDMVVTDNPKSETEDKTRQDIKDNALGWCGGYFTNKLKNSKTLFLADGTTITPYTYGGSASFRWGGYFLIDINGEKKPNKWGYDIFGFVLSSPEQKTLLDTGCFVIDKGGRYTSEILLNN